MHRLPTGEVEALSEIARHGHEPERRALPPGTGGSGQLVPEPDGDQLAQRAARLERFPLGCEEEVVGNVDGRLHSSHITVFPYRHLRGARRGASRSFRQETPRPLDPFLPLLDLGCDPRIGRYLLARLSFTVALVDPGAEERPPDRDVPEEALGVALEEGSVSGPLRRILHPPDNLGEARARGPRGWRGGSAHVRAATLVILEAQNATRIRSSGSG